MKADNPFTQRFLELYPTEAARILERLPAKDVATFLEALPAGLVLPVLETMTPDKSSSCLMQMAAAKAGGLLEKMNIARAGNIYRRLSREMQNNLSESWSVGTHKRLSQLLEYPALTAGDLMDSATIMMPKELMVAEVIERLEKNKNRVGCDIYVVDEQHCLVGLLAIDALLGANPKARIGDLMDSKLRPINARSPIHKVVKRREWMLRRMLPVVDSEGMLIGALTYARLQAATEDTPGSDDLQEGLLSLFGLYWLFLGQISNALFRAFETRKGPKR